VCDAIGVSPVCGRRAGRGLRKVRTSRGRSRPATDEGLTEQCNACSRQHSMSELPAVAMDGEGAAAPPGSTDSSGPGGGGGGGGSGAGLSVALERSATPLAVLTPTPNSATPINSTPVNMDTDAHGSGAAAAVPPVAPAASAGLTARPRANSRGSKHPLLPSAIIAPTGIITVSALSPASEAKRARMGEHTPGGSLLTMAQWSADVPMSPATTLMQQAFSTAKLAPSTPHGQKASIPPSPSRDGALPPTHPFTYPSSPALNTMAAAPIAGLQSSFSASSMPSLATASTGVAATSPTRSVRSSGSTASSPSSSFSQAGGNGSGSASSSNAQPNSPTAISLSPSAVAVQSLVQSHAQVLQAQAASTAAPVASQAAAVSVTSARRTSAAERLQQQQQQQQQQAAAHASPPDMDEDDDDGGKKKGDNRQGASCHQCKTTKDDQHLLFCTTKAGGARKRRCRKKYCDSCLSRTYGIHIGQILSDPVALHNWQCPSCAGNCTCAGCTRKVPAAPVTARSAQANQPVEPVEPTHTPVKRMSKAQQAAALRAEQQRSEQKLLDWNGAHPNGAYLPQTLPDSGILHGRAVSAPDFAHFQDPLNPFLFTNGSPAAYSQEPHGAQFGQPPPHQVKPEDDTHPSERDDASTASSAADAPAHMDAIASMLLDLSSSASSTSSTAEALPAGVQASTSAGPTASVDAAVMPPPPLPAASAIPTAAAAAAVPAVAHPYLNGSAAAAAGAAASVFPSAAALNRLPMAPVSLLQSPSGTLGMRPHMPLLSSSYAPPTSRAYTKYGLALQQQPAGQSVGAGSGMPPLLSQPPSGVRALSDATRSSLKRTRPMFSAGP